MNKVPIRVDGRFRLKELLGSGSYGMSFILEYYMLIQIQHMDPLSCCIPCTEHHQW
jgi:hypothetical protein